MQQIGNGHRAGTPEDWKWPPGRLDYRGISAAPSERMEQAGLRIGITEDGWRLADWR